MNEIPAIQGLIKSILSGNKQSYEELYEYTIHYVYKNVHFLIDEKDDVDDIVQDIYIELYKSLSSFDGSKKFKPWLTGIVIRQVQAYRRKRWMRIRIVKKAEQQKQVIGLDFSNEIIEKISNQHVIDLVNQLTFKLKQVIILRYLNDYTQEEIASILDIPLGTVKSRINAALKKLRMKESTTKICLEKVGNL
ncbi:sigma-70 family RNA polymerase sigma factor [Bacillus suaedaesalsae]|uniref:Sigma-70 family RNA polymerase sigma factor n=1 Tax=Bacillus suaedaesalsae TaxID=2810349 RepID=A0ABS2DI55_9BACI|nr:sigma-70 family RNA polymerase sigma factor [Bacillus suaedaesalsae]MBM6618174.1 sigma-70 family RNA polymerase sigma factor [Bacillus suaedaesalsae]